MGRLRLIRGLICEAVKPNKFDHVRWRIFLFFKEVGDYGNGTTEALLDITGEVVLHRPKRRFVLHERTGYVVRLPPSHSSSIVNLIGKESNK
jgi:hypothetical protein